MTLRRTPGVVNLAPYHPPLGGRQGTLRLDFNEWVGAAPPKLAEALASLTTEDLAIYPETGETVDAVAAHFGVGPENVVLANGTDEAFGNVYRAFLGRGDRLLIPDPGYPMMTFYATLGETEVVPWRLEPPRWEYDWQVAEDFLAGGGHGITIPRPNNPTGSMADGREVLALADRWNDRLVVVDEAYAEFTGSSLVHSAPETPNLLVLRTFSKAWAMAGLRVGAVVGPEDLIADLKKMWSPYSVNVVALRLLARLLPDPEWPRQVKAAVDVERERLREALEARGVSAHFAGGNYFMMHPVRGAKAFCDALARQGIRLRDQSSKNGLDGWVRVSIGDAAATDRFLQALDAEASCAS